MEQRHADFVLWKPGLLPSTHKSNVVGPTEHFYYTNTCIEV